jgi:hypothetical protein
MIMATATRYAVVSTGVYMCYKQQQMLLLTIYSCLFQFYTECSLQLTFNQRYKKICIGADKMSSIVDYTDIYLYNLVMEWSSWFYLIMKD